MKKVTAHFEHIDFAEFAIRNIKEKVSISDVSVKTYADNDSDTAYYPVRPEYLEPSHAQYLEGMPHVLSNGPIFNRHYEPSDKKDAVVSFSVRSEDESAALNTVMQFGGHNIRVEK
ncbi:MAG: hypothetical protein IJF54_04155 [Clostridia bacterium]|nr:hypothetical protein [Clostridia bacterium]